MKLKFYSLENTGDCKVLDSCWDYRPFNVNIHGNLVCNKRTESGQQPQVTKFLESNCSSMTFEISIDKV
jgi:hypothetical protein